MSSKLKYSVNVYTIGDEKIVDVMHHYARHLAHGFHLPGLA